MVDEIQALIHDCRDHSLHLSTELRPTPSPSQYLVRVHAAGITKDELQWAEPNALPNLTAIPGFDVAGVVLVAPSGQSKFRQGDKVYACTAAERPANAREVTVIEESEIAQMPKNVSFVDAAATPMSALTAAEALFERGNLTFESSSSENALKSVLIIGASGAVGLWAIQLARWAGVGRVVGMCSTANTKFVESMGAHAVIDYTQRSLSHEMAAKGNDEKFDLVLACVGGRTLTEAWTACKANGHLLSIAQPIGDSRPETGVSDGVHATFFILKMVGAVLTQLSLLVEQDLIRPVVDSIYSFEDFQLAFNRVATGHAKGKVVLEVRQDSE
jgi:NADPH:quinone reductase-like Zn-dependent oxidoreductase